MSELPTGTVTFVFTDIEGSTALLDRLGDSYGEVLFAHRTLLRAVWEEHGGVEVSTEGVLPREHNDYWGGVMAGRIASARAALGAQAADAAYARGRAHGVDEVMELLLSYGAPAAVAS